MKLHIPKDPVLIADDETDILDTYKQILSLLGIPFELYGDGLSAWKAFQIKKFSIIITDIEMPHMNGIELIQKIKEVQNNALILVGSGMDDPNTIIEVMKLGVFDYILKPFQLDQLKAVITRTLEYYYQKEQEKIQSLYAAEKLKAQIEWLNYKESARIRDTHHSTLRNLQDMKNSFLEGASIGSMMTMIYMIKDTMQPTENGYLVDKDLIETLIECNEVCNHQFEGIYNITQILESDVHLKEMTCEEFNQKVSSWIKPILVHFTRKNVSVTYPTLHSKAIVEIDETAFIDVVQELLFNAYKYTVPNSTINVFAFISEGYMILTVKNDVNENPYSGIPKEYEKILIEPFIRLHTNDEYIIKVEKFGLGLGLTVVDNIIKKHNGMFFIHDVVDYTTSHKKLCVAAEVFLPIKKK